MKIYKKKETDTELIQKRAHTEVDILHTDKLPRKKQTKVNTEDQNWNKSQMGETQAEVTENGSGRDKWRSVALSITFIAL